MKLFLFTLYILAFTQSVGQNNELRRKHFNTKHDIALEGYDPVSYFDGKPLEGRSTFKALYNGIIYLFTTQSNLERFRSNPLKYEPAYGGWCAYAMGENGDKVKIDPETFKILEGKLYLFYNFWGTNTLEDWNEKEKELKVSGDKNWKKFIP